jgi:hypothetical protein
VQGRSEGDAHLGEQLSVLALRTDQVDFFGVAIEQGDTDLSPLQHGGRRGGDLGAKLGDDGVHPVGAVDRLGGDP